MVHVWNTSRRKRLIPCQFRRRQNERCPAKLARYGLPNAKSSWAESAPAALSHFMAAHARSVASWPTAWLGFPTSCLTARRGPRNAFLSQATRRYVQSAIPILGPRMGRSCGLGRVHMQTLALISFYAPGSDYHSRRPCGRLFVLLGFPTTAEPGVERDRPAACSILVLARAAVTTLTQIARQELESRLSSGSFS